MLQGKCCFSVWLQSLGIHKLRHGGHPWHVCSFSLCPFTMHSFTSATGNLWRSSHISDASYQPCRTWSLPEIVSVAHNFFFFSTTFNTHRNFWETGCGHFILRKSKETWIWSRGGWYGCGWCHLHWPWCISYVSALWIQWFTLCFQSFLYPSVVCRSWAVTDG